MRAVRQHAFGGPEQLVLEDVRSPAPGPGQVRVVVRAAGVHLLDTSIREGTGFGTGGAPSLPMTPGREVAGRVDGVGHGVDRAWLGRDVVVHLGPDGSGGYAEQVLAPVERLHVLPGPLDHATAVAAIGTGRTALGLLDQVTVTPDDVVLVTSSAGGLGVLFLQHLRSVGAYAVGLAGGPAKVALATKHGADLAVDYLEDGWQDAVRHHVAAPDLLLDGVGGPVAEAAAALLAPGATVLSFGWSSGEHARWPDHVRIDAPLGPRLLGRPGGLRSLETDALAAATDGTRVPLVTTYPLERAADAHRDLEARRTSGKVVLTVEGEGR